MICYRPRWFSRVLLKAKEQGRLLKWQHKDPSRYSFNRLSRVLKLKGGFQANFYQFNITTSVIAIFSLTLNKNNIHDLQHTETVILLVCNDYLSANDIMVQLFLQNVFSTWLVVSETPYYLIVLSLFLFFVLFPLLLPTFPFFLLLHLISKTIRKLYMRYQ